MGILAGFKRCLPMIGYHHVIMVICSTAIILLSVLLAGCTSSNGLGNVYLLSLQYRNTSASHQIDPTLVNLTIAETTYRAIQPLDNKIIEVRVGYMGICLTRSDHLRICSGNAAALASIAKGDDTNGTADPLNLIWIAKNFKQKIVFDGLIFIAIVLIFICFLLLCTFPGWHRDGEIVVKPFPSRQVSYAAVGVSALGFIFGLVSIVWQHISSSSAATMSESLSYGAIESHVGATAMVLGWIAVVCMALAVLAQLVMIRNIKLIRQLMDDE